VTRPPSDDIDTARARSRARCDSHVRSLARPLAGAAIATVLLGGPGDARAAGLGRLAVQSALGQPLVAEVELTLRPGESLTDLSARVVIPQSQSGAAADPHHNAILAGAAVSAHRRANGQPYLRIRTMRPLSEPLLEFIVEVQGGGGAVGRWYAALLDPPGYVDTIAAPRTEMQNSGRPVIAPLTGAGLAASQAAPAAPAERTMPPRDIAPAPALAPAPRIVEPRAPRVVATPAPRPVAPPRAEAPPAPRPADPIDGRYGPVRPGETLFGIASRLRPAGVSVEQMQAALHRANPGAFIDGNMAKLRAGSVLVMPNETPIATGATPAAPRAAPDPTPPRAVAPPPPAPGGSGDRLQIVDPAANEGALSADEAQLIRRRQVLEGELVARQDELRTVNERISQFQVGDLSERIRALEDIAQRRQAELEAVSRRIEELAATEAPAPAGTIGAAAPVSPAPTAGTQAAATPAEAVPAKGARTTATPGTPPAAPTPSSAPVEADEALDPMLVAGLSGLVLAFVGGLGIWWWRRRRESRPEVHPVAPAMSAAAAGPMSFGPRSVAPDPAFSRPGGEISGLVDTGQAPHSVDPAVRAQLDALAKEWAEEEAAKAAPKAAKASGTRPPSIDDDSLDFSLEPLPHEQEAEQKNGKSGLDLRLD